MQKSVVADDSIADINVSNNAKPFMDSISAIQWLPPSQSNPNPPNMIAVTTWDGSIRVYEVTNYNGQAILEEKLYFDGQPPITCCTWDLNSNTSLTFACVDGSIKTLDLVSRNITQIGKSDIISNLHFIPNINAVVSLGYDKAINFWQSNSQSPVFTHSYPSKIYVSDYCNGILAAGTDEEKILIFDVLNMNNFIKPSVSDSFLQKKSQLSCMSLNHDATSVSYGSIDGRGNISTIKKSASSLTANAHTLTSFLIFKANRHEIQNNFYVYPVNGIGFNVKNERWLFTAAADGLIQFWNFSARSLVKSLNFNKVPVTQAKVNKAGDLIVYALGDDWHQGPKGKGKWNTKLACHFIPDIEVKFAWKDK